MAFVLISALLSGCGDGKREENTLTINLAGRNMDALVEGLRAQFPDIHFDIYRYMGSNGSGFLRETIMHNDASDLVFYTQRANEEALVANLMDLSGYGFVGENVDRAMLEQYAMDGHLYQIPGPVVLRCMAYNKTIFDEHGWEAPQSFAELVALVKRIRAEEPELIPIAMSLGGAGYCFTCITTFAQAGFLSTPSGALWEQRYQAGEASVGEGWGEGLDMFGALIDAGAFYRAEEFVDLWDAQVINGCFAKGEAAMMFVWGGQNALVSTMQNCEYELDLLPFYGIEAGQTILGTNSGVNWSINKRLEEKGQEKKLENALRVMKWFTTAEAQALMAMSAAEIPSLKNADVAGLDEKYRKLWERAQNGQKAAMIYSGYEDVIVEGGTIAMQHMLAGDSRGMKEAFIEAVDAIHAQTLAKEEETVSYGILSETLSTDQSVQLVANAMASAQLGDFALVTKSEGEGNPNGISGWLYAGAIDGYHCIILIPEKANQCVAVVPLSGALVKRLLEQGRPATATEEENGVFWTYYWSGLDVTMKKGKVVSARLNGNELKDDEVYRVVMIDGDYWAEWAENGAPEPTNITLQSIFIDYVRQNTPVSAPQVLRK